MIPQAPELMAGTVRQCLDPYAQYDDVALNDALLAAGFSGAHSEAGEKISLDFTLANGGSNLSLGQRYVMERDCLVMFMRFNTCQANGGSGTCHRASDKGAHTRRSYLGDRQVSYQRRLSPLMIIDRP
jgi:hypothetical protein